MTLVPLLASSPYSLCTVPSSTSSWALAFLFIFVFWSLSTHLFTLSSGLRASFPRELAIPAFRSLCRSPPSYKSPRYKTIFFIVQVFADGALFCVSSEVLASQQNCCHCLEKSRLFIYMSCPFVSDSVRSSSHDSSLQKCSKKLMKKHQFQKNIHFEKNGIFCMEIWIFLLKLVAYFLSTVGACKHCMNTIHLPTFFWARVSLFHFCFKELFGS